MPKEDYEFISTIQHYMLSSTNMKSREAWDFAFCVWQSKKWLTEYLVKDARSDITYQQGRADERDEMLKNAHRSLRLIYEKGKADAEKEHTEMCNSCIHKVSKEDIDAIRADAIDEVIKVIEPYIADINTNEVWAHSDNEKTMFDWICAWKIALYRKLEQLKEQNNDK